MDMWASMKFWPIMDANLSELYASFFLILLDEKSLQL